MTAGPFVFAMPGSEQQGRDLADRLGGETGVLETRRFPDGESYVRIVSIVAGRNIVLVCSLARPDDQFLRLVFAARLNTATPKAGLGFELDVIAACFIGGASASGGVGKVMGAVIGAFIMGVMNNGMSILGIGIDYQQVIKGLVLLAAVFIDVYNKNK